MGANCAFSLVPLLVEQLHKGSWLSTVQLPFQKVSLWHTHCSTKSLSSFPHTTPLQKAKSLSQSQLAVTCLCSTQVWSLTILGHRFPLSLSYSPGWCLALHLWTADPCVCVGWIFLTSSIVPSHSRALGWGFPVWDRGSLPWEGNGPQSCDF